MVSSTSPTPTDWVLAYDAMLDAWQQLSRPKDQVLDWDESIVSMCAEMSDLRIRGQWRSGGRTLLRELGIHHNEVLLCRGLAWLLTPDGWHGLGARFLTGILAALGASADGAGAALVATEECRHWTRADIIVRLADTTLIFEAKIFALEQPDQADRIADEWADEHPTLVFLTRTGAQPVTAVESLGMWRTLTWRQLAGIADTAATATSAASNGAWEFIETLKEYGGP